MLQADEMKKQLQAIIEEDGNVHLSEMWIKPFCLSIDCWAQDTRLHNKGVEYVNGLYGERMGITQNISRYLKAHPEILQVPVRRPVFIVGLPRTGTTFLFNLLSQDKQFLAPPYWQIAGSLIPPPKQNDEDDPRIQLAKMKLNGDKANTESQKKHERTPVLPEECKYLIENTFCGRVGHVIKLGDDDFKQWFDSDQPELWSTVYIFYKKQLQLLAYNQGKGDKPYLRKDYNHLARIGQVLQVFPDACIIHPTRKMSSGIASSISLFSTLMKDLYNDTDIDMTILAKSQLNHQKFITDQFVKYRKVYDNELPDGAKSSFIDISFDDIVSSPMDVVKAIYEHFNIPLATETRTAMLDYISKNQRYKLGYHSYNLSEYGLDEGTVNNACAAYIDYFNIAS